MARHVLWALAAALAVAGSLVIVDARIDVERARAEEAACRAAKDGLDELACMDFTGIGASIQTALGVALLAGALGPVAAALWLRGRPSARAVALVAAVAATGALALWAWMAASGSEDVFRHALAAALAASALGLGVVALRNDDVSRRAT